VATTEKPVPPATTVSTTTSAPSTTLAADTTTTTLPPDYADPMAISIPSVGIEAPVGATGPTFGSNEWYPDFGEVEWWHDEALGAPCEAGAVFLLGHVTAGDAFHDLVSDEREKDGTVGVAAGDLIDITLTDGTICRYQVVTLDQAAGQPLGRNQATGTDRPGWYVLKDGFGGQPRETLLEITGQTSRLFLFTSYAGPCGCEFEERDGGSHRIYSAYIAADLTAIISEEG
jgi:hypothetical protein